jgi:hypothetical protein
MSRQPWTVDSRRTMALRSLNVIKALAASNESGDILTRAHRAHRVYVIKEGLDD